jgi:hypothetical protein
MLPDGGETTIRGTTPPAVGDVELASPSFSREATKAVSAGTQTRAATTAPALRVFLTLLLQRFLQALV